jgi:c(7)-type cytochrome triheme protein
MFTDPRPQQNNKFPSFALHIHAGLQRGARKRGFAASGQLLAANSKIPGSIKMKSAKTLILALSLVLAFACLLQWNGCAAEKDSGMVVYPGGARTAGPVAFSHRSHGTRGAGYACDKCHTSASSKALMVTMEDIRQGKACGTCHDGRTRGLQGKAAAASIQDCDACHMPDADIVITLNRMDPVVFSHARHLSVDSKKKVSIPSGFSCSDCHPIPFERVSKGPIGMEVPHESGGCAQCHTGKKRSDGMPAAFAANTRCLNCHKS